MSRVVDHDLLQRVREQHCVVCGATPCDPHHLTTRGAGGGDTIENCVAVCRLHHSEIHQLGIGRASNKYPALYRWLVEMGRYDILERAARFSHG